MSHIAPTGRAAAYQREAAGNEAKNKVAYFNWELLGRYNIEQLKPKEGTNILAIIPPEDINAYIGHHIYPHFDVGPNKKAFLCPKEHGIGPCPICEVRDDLRSQGASNEELRAYNCWPGRYVFMVWNVESLRDAGTKVYIFDAPNKFNKELLELARDPRTKAVLDVADLDNGYDISFNRKGTGKTTEYYGFKLMQRQPIPEDWLALLDGVPKIEDFLVFSDYATIKKEMGAFGCKPRQDAPAPGYQSRNTASLGDGRQRFQQAAVTRDADDLPYEVEAEPAAAVADDAIGAGIRNRAQAAIQQNEAPQSQGSVNTSQDLSSGRRRRSA